MANVTMIDALAQTFPDEGILGQLRRLRQTPIAHLEDTVDSNALTTDGEVFVVRRRPAPWSRAQQDAIGEGILAARRQDVPAKAIEESLEISHDRYAKLLRRARQQAGEASPCGRPRRAKTAPKPAP